MDKIYNEYNKEKSRKGLVIINIILLLLVIGLVLFILYDKKILFNKEEKVVEIKSDLNSEQLKIYNEFELVYNELFLNAEKTLITKSVKKEYRIEKREELLALVEKLENGEAEYIRNFVGFFFEAAKRGDGPALDYCAVMAKRGAQAISALANQLEFDGDEIEVVLSGSINVKLDNAFYIDMLKSKAQAYCEKRLKFIKLTAMPVTGCINWILQEFAN